MTLLVLAAGMGSRFGGLKQMEPMGPNGEFIIDYSIYDAKRAGFNKVVFVIKKSMYEDFKNTIGKRIENQIDVEYVFQEIDNSPIKIKFERIKPLGTAHAILIAKDSIKENFAIVNSDDFYGYHSFQIAYEFLKNNNNNNEYGLIGYHAINTMTDNGMVKRGICLLDNRRLSGIIESSVTKEDDHIHCKSLTNNNEFDIENNRLVSMNMLLFTPSIFKYLKKDFVNFVNSMIDKQNEELIISNVIDKHIKNNDITVEVLETDSKWYGVTYSKDKELVVNAINSLIDKGVYPNKLWDK